MCHSSNQRSLTRTLCPSSSNAHWLLPSRTTVSRPPPLRADWTDAGERMLNLIDWFRGGAPIKEAPAAWCSPLTRKWTLSWCCGAHSKHRWCCSEITGEKVDDEWSLLWLIRALNIDKHKLYRQERPLHKGDYHCRAARLQQGHICQHFSWQNWIQP